MGGMPKGDRCRESLKIEQPVSAVWDPQVTDLTGNSVPDTVKGVSLQVEAVGPSNACS